jgi:peptide/nickel transport system substrate-binding protein
MMTRLLATSGMLALSIGMMSAAAQAQTVVTMNTVQIFGTIDPAKISDYTDYMAAVNLYDSLDHRRFRRQPCAGDRRKLGRGR